jgi:hypothetical protein
MNAHEARSIMPLVRWLPRVLVIALISILALEVFTITPRLVALVLVACAAWMALPGVALVSAALRPHPSARFAGWLFGPAFGFGLSVFGLLLFWVAGLHNWLALLLAPSLTWLLVVVARRWGGPTLRLPTFDRRDTVALLLALLVVPLITFAPYENVRRQTPDGEAYRAYFTADFIWAMTVTADLAKGHVPPKNPFLRDEPLHYYWMSHMLSGAVYQNVRALGVTSEQVILTDGLGFGLAFVAFLYGLARVVGGNAVFSALAVACAFLANSYEGLERLMVYRAEGMPLETLRDVNIDAVTRWYHAGMPVDGLQRMLLYQPHHITGYMMALAALWIVGTAEDVTETAVALWAGVLLGLAVLFSTFTAIIMSLAVAVLFAFRLLQRRAWIGMVQSGILGALPVIVAVVLANVLGYTDPKQGMLLQVGVNPVALRHWPLVLLLNFGPLLFAGLVSLLRPRWLLSQGAAATALVLAAFAFYFLTDVPDQEGVWVGWRAGHLLLIGFAAMAAATLTAAWTRMPTPLPVIVALVLAIAPAIPTVAIDVYNAQDITNRHRGPSFPWTVIITPKEREALNWIRGNTPDDAVVQVDPRAHHSGTWAYIQAFAERRAVAGLPGAMIPFLPYALATDSVTFGIFRAGTAHDAVENARFLGIDYVVVGPAERERYPEADKIFAASPELFVPVFTNEAVSVYDVRKR